MLASEAEIDQLASRLLGTRDAEQTVQDAACKATEARQWDEVIR